MTTSGTGRVARRVLVTGATGYIGGRLAPRLAAAGHQVRVTARSPQRLRDAPWAAEVEVVQADVLEPGSLGPAMQGCDVAYYLVHSMHGGGGFEDTDRRAAEVFAGVARRSGVQRIVYLGGLLPPRADELSPHLRSRREVGEILLASGVPTAILQAGMILGSGSASFEMLRHLTERLPAMVTPRWVDTRVQPIAVRDMLRYLCGAVSLPPEVHRSFDVGGPDVMTYADIMQCYAATAGLRRRVLLRVPVLTPRLSSLWVNIVTPVPAAIARPLVESLRHEMVCHENDIQRWIADPPDGLLGVDQAIRLALQRVSESAVETRWSTASWPGGAETAPSDLLPSDPMWAGGTVYRDERSSLVDAQPGALWDVIEGIGGENGWYSWPLAWSVRGWLDRLVGGVGLRRGRRDPRRLRVGEALDFWRVEEVRPSSLLRLRAEMRLPGTAWLELRVATAQDEVRYVQCAVFQPRGLLGHLYWWLVKPFHGVVFGGMQRNVVKAAAHG